MSDSDEDAVQPYVHPTEGRKTEGNHGRVDTMGSSSHNDYDVNKTVTGGTRSASSSSYSKALKSAENRFSPGSSSPKSNPSEFDYDTPKKENSFIGIKLNEGASAWNVASLLAASLASMIISSMTTDFISYLLDENFNIVDSEASKVISNMGLTATIVELPIKLLLGALMDLTGRKWLAISGLALMGLS